MNMKYISLMVAAAAIVASLSCSKNKDDKPIEGRWSSMVWVTESGKRCSIANVPAAGGELTFFCRNYPSPWISSAKLNGKYYYPNEEANDYWTITVDWFKAEINDNKLTVVVEANDTGEERQVEELAVTAGNTFYTFKFKQSAN